jgi:hypothetical protein
MPNVKDEEFVARYTVKNDVGIANNGDAPVAGIVNKRPGLRKEA